MRTPGRDQGEIKLKRSRFRFGFAAITNTFPRPAKSQLIGPIAVAREIANGLSFPRLDENGFVTGHFPDSDF